MRHARTPTFNKMTQKNVEGTLQARSDAAGGASFGSPLGADYRGSSFDYQPDHGLVTNDSSRTTRPSDFRPQNVREVFGEWWCRFSRILAVHPGTIPRSGATSVPVRPVRGVNTWKADLNWKAGVYSLCARRLCQGHRAPSLGELFAPTVTGNLNIGAGPSAGGSLRHGQRIPPRAPAPLKFAALCQAQGIPAALYPTYTYGVRLGATAPSGGQPKLTTGDRQHLFRRHRLEPAFRF